MKHVTTTDFVQLDDATAVPLGRLGDLLRDARGDVDLVDIAARSDGRFAPFELLDVEQGLVQLTDEQISDLMEIYDADPGQLVVSRSHLVIDLDEGTVAAGPWSTSFSPDNDSADDVLVRYLALVYEMRGLPAGTPIPLRTLDVSVLSEALAMPSVDVEARLHILMDSGSGRIERLRTLLRAKVLIPAIGLVVGVTGAGVLLLVPNSEAVPGVEVGRAIAVATAEAFTTTVDQPANENAPVTGEAPGLQDPVVAPEPSTATATPAAPGGDDVVLGEGLTIENPDPLPVPTTADGATGGEPDGSAEPPASGGGDDDVVLGEGLTIENPDAEP